MARTLHKPLTSLALALTLLFLRISLAAQQASQPQVQNASAANPVPSQAETANKVTVHSNLVFLPTRVQKKNGETIYGLKAEQFIVEDNGARQTAQIEQDPEAAGLSLVVVLQCSRSAALEIGKLKNLGTMIAAIVGNDPHEVAVMSYGEVPYLLSYFSSRPEVVQAGLSRLRSCGVDAQATTIDSVYYAIGMLKRQKNHYRRAILLIGENRDHGSHSRLEEVVAELGVTDTVVYSATFAAAKDSFLAKLRHPSGRPQPTPEFKPWPVASSSPQPAPPPQPSPSAESAPAATSAPTPPEPIYLVHPPRVKLPARLLLTINALRRNSASQLASLSGGEYMRFSTQRSLEDELYGLSNRIHNYYLLSFTPPSVPTFDLHSLKVRVPDYPDALIQTRRSYWSGTIETPLGEDRPSH